MSIIVTDHEPEQQPPSFRPSVDLMRYIITLALGALVAYYTAQGAVNAEIAAIRATQNSQFSEVLRRMDILQADIRELRSRP